MGMNLDELEEARPARRKGHFSTLWDQTLDPTKQVFGAKDYIPDTRYDRKALPPAQDPNLVDPRTTVIGPVKKLDGFHRHPGCNAVSGYWELCEHGTVGCTNHRRSGSRFFRCYVNHHDALCKCNQPVIVDYRMLENAENAAMHVLGALKPDAPTHRLSREDLDYLAISVSRMMAHWARKALGHKPEDEK